MDQELFNIIYGAIKVECEGSYQHGTAGLILLQTEFSTDVHHSALLPLHNLGQHGSQLPV